MRNGEKEGCIKYEKGKARQKKRTIGIDNNTQTSKKRSDNSSLKSEFSD
jgi:hypothetical protein